MGAKPSHFFARETVNDPGCQKPPDKIGYKAEERVDVNDGEPTHLQRRI